MSDFQHVLDSADRLEKKLGDLANQPKTSHSDVERVETHSRGDSPVAFDSEVEYAAPERIWIQSIWFAFTDAGTGNTAFHATICREPVDKAIEYVRPSDDLRNALTGLMVQFASHLCDGPTRSSCNKCDALDVADKLLRSLLAKEGRE